MFVWVVWLPWICFAVEGGGAMLAAVDRASLMDGTLLVFRPRRYHRPHPRTGHLLPSLSTTVWMHTFTRGLRGKRRDKAMREIHTHDETPLSRHRYDELPTHTTKERKKPSTPTEDPAQSCILPTHYPPPLAKTAKRERRPHLEGSHFLRPFRDRFL